MKFSIINEHYVYDYRNQLIVLHPMPIALNVRTSVRVSVTRKILVSHSRGGRMELRMSSVWLICGIASFFASFLPPEK